MEDLQIQIQFDLFRRILFMEDGEFALSLSEQLFEKVKLVWNEFYYIETGYKLNSRLEN